MGSFDCAVEKSGEGEELSGFARDILSMEPLGIRAMTSDILDLRSAISSSLFCITPAKICEY